MLSKQKSSRRTTPSALTINDVLTLTIKHSDGIPNLVQRHIHGSRQAVAPVFGRVPHIKPYRSVGNNLPFCLGPRKALEQWLAQKFDKVILSES